MYHCSRKANVTSSLFHGSSHSLGMYMLLHYEFAKHDPLWADYVVLSFCCFVLPCLVFLSFSWMISRT